MKRYKQIILTAVMVLCLLCGCGKTRVETTEEEAARFLVVYRQNTAASSIRVIEDTETGVKYLFVQSGYGGGLTKLEE